MAALFEPVQPLLPIAQLPDYLFDTIILFYNLRQLAHYNELFDLFSELISLYTALRQHLNQYLDDGSAVALRLIRMNIIVCHDLIQRYEERLLLEPFEYLVELFIGLAQQKHIFNILNSAYTVYVDFNEPALVA